MKLFIAVTLLIVCKVESVREVQCPDDWTPRPGSSFCYRFYNHIQLNWNQAKMHCEAQDSVLVTIENKFEKTFIAEKSTSSRYLIGLRKIKDGAKFENWQWLDNKMWSNSPGTPIVWDANQPDEDAWSSLRRCVALNTNTAKMTDLDCDSYQYNFICKRDVNKPLFCPPYWSHFNERCYKLFTDNPNNWFFVEEQCQVNGGQLLVVTKPEEAQFLIDAMANVGENRAWIGLHKEAGENQTFEWIGDQNQTTVDISDYWGYGEPHMFDPDNQYCVEAWSYDQAWHAVACGANSAYICERPTGGCVRNWQEYMGNCFQINDDAASYVDWWTAHRTCAAQNAALVQMNDETFEFGALENRFLMNIGTGYFWLGVTDCQNFNESAEVADCLEIDPEKVVWYDSKTSVFDGYNNFFRNDSLQLPTSSPQCAFIDYFNGEWDFWDCGYGNHFFCKAAAGTNIKPINGSFEDHYCPENWEKYGDYCYQFIHKNAKRQDAVNECNKLGTPGKHQAFLTSIIHPEEEAFLTENMRSDYWMGLNDMKEEGVYRWQDGSALGTYVNWADDEPSGDHEKNYVAVSDVTATATGEYAGKWKVLAGDDLSNSYVCKMKSFDPNDGDGDMSTTDWPNQCGAYWRYEPITGYCYRISDDYSTWTDAEQWCLSWDAQLASIHSVAEMAVVTEYMKQEDAEVWFGANDRDTHGGWQYSDGSAFNYVYWTQGAPTNYNSDQHCALIKNGDLAGQWKDAQCTLRRQWLCKKWGGGPTTTKPFTMPVSKNPDDVYDCPEGWTSYGRHCYQVVQTPPLSQPDALKDCRKKGGDLASIHSANENAFLESLATSAMNYPKLWIGLVDEAGSGLYEWSDGTTMDYSNWNVNEPNDWGGIEDEDCVELFSDWSANGKWNDINCRYQRSYVCKTEKNWHPPPTGPVTESGCPIGYKAYGYSCYLFADDKFITWDATNNTCRGLGPSSYLVHVNDIQEQAFLTAQLGQRSGTYAIGTVHDQNTNSYRYEDGTEMTYSHWDSHYPDETKGKCVSATSGLTAGLWQNSPCNSLSMHYVCEMPRAGYTTTPTTSPTTLSDDERCPNEFWIRYPETGSCYRAYSMNFAEAKKTWPEADVICKQMGGYLATIPDSQTNDFMLNNVTANTPDFFEDGFWIGLNSLSGSEEWADGSPLVFDKWGNKQPDHGQNNENKCVMFERNSGGTWFEINCAQTRSFICQIPIGVTYSTLPPYSVTPPTECQGIKGESGDQLSCFYGYSTDATDTCYCIAGGEYWFTTNNWHDADQSCINIGKNNKRYGHLMAIHSQQVQDQLITFLQRTGYWGSKFYVGLSELKSSDGSFGWSDGSALDFSFWGDGEPNDAGYAGEGCVEVDQTTGKWNDIHCTVYQPYICQIASSAPFTPSPQLPIEGGCQAGWVKGAINCYKLVTRQSWQGYPTYDIAKSECQTNYNNSAGKGGDLARIDSGETQLRLMASMADSEAGAYWIGLSDTSRWGEFRWSDGFPLTYTNWAMGQPQSGSTNGDCVALRIDGSKDVGKWETNDCMNYDYSRGYICELDPDPVLTTPAPESGCAWNYTKFGESCYILTETPGTFDEAEASCQAMGSYNHLASIMNSQEEMFIRLWLHGHQPVVSSAWIGMKEKEGSGFYEWIDGWPVLFTNWAQGQPSKQGGEGCVASTEHNGHSFWDPKWYDWQGTWEDLNCTDGQPRYGVCKYTNGIKPSASPETCPGMTCPPVQGGIHWIDAGGCNCYSYQAGVKVTQMEAHKSCLQLGADLISIHSEEENMFVYTHLLKYMSTNPWIGLLASKTSDGGYIWTDGTPVEYTNWAWGEPNNFETAEDCVQIYNKGYGQTMWNDLFCDTLLEYICKTPKVPLPSKTTPAWTPDGYCGDDQNWILFDGNCYYVSEDWWTQKSWQDAEKFCNGMGANSHLLSIHTQQEVDFVKNIFYHPGSPHYDWRFQNYWIGLNELDTRGDWRWTDKSAFDFVNWAPNEPNDAFGSESCAEWMGNQEGLWNDDHCSVNKMFMCKKPNSTTTVPSTTPTPPGGCPTGWIQNTLNRKCYQWHKENVNWTTARDNCIQDGADLVSIHSDTEQAFLVSEMAYAEYNVWIGLNNMRSSWEYFWSDETTFLYENWDLNEPYHPSDQQANCVVMINHRMKAGHWQAIGCNDVSGYLCSKPEVPGLPTQGPPGKSNCTGHYSYYNQACYELVTEGKGGGMSWSAAETRCEQDKGGHLMSVTNIYESNFLYHFIKTQQVIDGVWIGLSRKDSNIFSWVDGWPVQYTNWGDNQPDGGENECVMASGSDGTWDDTTCSTQLKGVCKISNLSPPQTSTGRPGNCPVSKDTKYGFVDSGSEFCYQILFDAKVSWGQAQLQCLLAGAELVSFHDMYELNFIKDYLYLLVGMPVWIGLIRKPNGGWQWSDGSPFDLDYWASGSPSDDDGMQLDCVTMNDQTAQWVNGPCNPGEGNPFVCKAPKIPPTTTQYRSSTTPKNPFVTRTPKETNPNEFLGLSTNGIIGIILAFFTGVALVAVVLLYIQQCRNKQDDESDSNSQQVTEDTFGNDAYEDDKV